MTTRTKTSIVAVIGVTVGLLVGWCMRPRTIQLAPAQSASRVGLSDIPTSGAIQLTPEQAARLVALGVPAAVVTKTTGTVALIGPDPADRSSIAADVYIQNLDASKGLFPTIELACEQNGIEVYEFYQVADHYSYDPDPTHYRMGPFDLTLDIANAVPAGGPMACSFTLYLQQHFSGEYYKKHQTVNNANTLAKTFFTIQ
jgi:hypothetical protein